MRKALLSALGACAVALVVTAPLASASMQPNIIGGHDASETYSFYVSLDNGCGGSLVAPQWIVTADHCGGAAQGRIGSINRNSGGEMGRIDHRITKPGTDLTLMHLSSPARSTPVRMAQQNPEPGTTIRLMGLGCEVWPNCHQPMVVQEIDLQIIPSDSCREGGGGPGDICIAGSAGHTACHGDSGGPGVVGSPGDWTLVGETHGPGDNGPDCAGLDLYTGIAQHRAWIDQQIGQQPSS